MKRSDYNLFSEYKPLKNQVVKLWADHRKSGKMIEFKGSIFSFAGYDADNEVHKCEAIYKGKSKGKHTWLIMRNPMKFEKIEALPNDLWFPVLK